MRYEHVKVDDFNDRNAMYDYVGNLLHPTKTECEQFKRLFTAPYWKVARKVSESSPPPQLPRAR